MNKLHHGVWFFRWIQRLSSSLLRRRKLIDLVPSFLAPRHRYLFDRRIGRVHRITLRKTLSDYWSYDQCLAVTALDLSRFSQGDRLRKRYDSMLDEGRTPVILDCGANIGCSAYWLGIEFPRAQVIAVEPDEGNVQLALRNTRQCTNVHVVHGAVSSADCMLSLCHTDHGSDAFRTEISTTGEVRGYSINALLNIVGAGSEDLLLAKIDIEGFEQELFSRNTEWVESAGAIIVETHDWMMPGQATATPLLRALSRVPRDFLVDGEHVLSFRI